MTKINDGGPAFPRTLQRWNDSLEQVEGMSLRDWFAGVALPQAVLDYGEPQAGSSAGVRRDRGNPVLPYATSIPGMKREEIIAAQAYRYADAMLAERERSR